ncbi:hypothetical protein ABT369_39555 [Dactylosporangium sp. NPDC000244]|uniref:hypothetical protein n=1 Tax=Dactylosporangium sp. NPDC000244 TaxID=3154365 RepID=UPI00332B7E03
MRTADLELLRDVAACAGDTHAGVYTYAYLPMWKQYAGATWDGARVYVTAEVRHTPGLCSEVTGAARRLLAAGLIELGPSGWRRAERPLVLTDAGRAFLDGTIRR